MKRVLFLFLFATLAWGQELTLEAIFAESGLTGRAPEHLKWSPDGSKLSFVLRDDVGERATLYYVDAASGRSAVLIAAEKLGGLVPPLSRFADEERERRERYAVAAYEWAPDSRHLLFNSRGQLWLYSLATGTAVQLTSRADESVDPKFSPDGQKISFVRGRNLWVRSVRDPLPTVQITSDEDPNVLNGEVDWVYAEELDVRSNHFWSPNSKQILFLQTNETPVPSHPMVDLLPVHAAVGMQKYPQAGDPNPVVRLGVVGTQGGRVKWLKLPVEQHVPDKQGTRPREAQDFYLPRFGWVRDGLAWAQVLNRAQDRLDLYFIEVETGRTQLMLTEASDAWVEVTDDFQIVGGDRFLWSSWRDGHTHLYLYSFARQDPLSAPARLERQLTRGDFESFGIEGVDEKGGWVYFIANPGDPRQRNLYRVKLDGSGFERVTPADGTHKVKFNRAATAYADVFSDTMAPGAVAMCAVVGRCIRFWEPRSLAAHNLVAPRFLEFRADDGTVLYGTLLMPPGDGRAPLILNPYGGPGVNSQKVRRAWGEASFLFDQMLLRRGFAVLRVDNRGMGGRGKKFAAALKGQFGEVETRDQLAALEQALALEPRLDRERVGFWGWSYGGTMTLWLTTRSQAFRAAVSVAPVTDSRLYDSIYTERYMGLPSQNPEGYKQASNLDEAANLHGALLLVHGTGDDNVHLQNSVALVQELIKVGKQFDLMLYPRKAHAISGTTARVHLYRRILEHFERELKESR